MEAVLLKPVRGGRFHFGEVSTFERTALEDTAIIPHSDVLFSGLVNVLSRIEVDEVDPFIDHVRAGRLRLSSGCYVLENTQTGSLVWFLPKPLSLNLVQTGEPKKLKGIQFLSRGVWERGLGPDDWFRSSGECLVLQDTFVVLKTELPEADATLKLFAKQTTPKVKVRNVNPNQEDGFYHQTDLLLTGSEIHRVRWYFLIDGL